MPRIICWQLDCLYNVDAKCRAEEIEYDPADGCMTLQLREPAEEVEEEEGWERGGMHVTSDDE